MFIFFCHTEERPNYNRMIILGEQICENQCQIIKHAEKCIVFSFTVGHLRYKRW